MSVAVSKEQLACKWLQKIAREAVLRKIFYFCRSMSACDCSVKRDLIVFTSKKAVHEKKLRYKPASPSSVIERQIYRKRHLVVFYEVFHLSIQENCVIA